MTFRSSGPAEWSRPLVAIILGVILATTAVGAGFVLSRLGSSSTSGVGAPSCLRANDQVADPSAPHGEFILDPPTNLHNEFYTDVQTYLLNNPVVCGADFWVPWSNVETGTVAQPLINFSSVDSGAAPWIAAGKVVNLIFQIVGTGPQTQYLPSSVEAAVPTFQCNGSAVTPVEWNATFEAAYQAFVTAAVHHYDNRPGFGYLRFGFGFSGEVFPVENLNSPSCQKALAAVGFSIPIWNNYVTGMISFEHGLDSKVQLMIAPAPIQWAGANNVTSVASAAAAADGIGIGNEGFEVNDTTVVEPDGVGCGGHGWCQQFWRYSGVIPLELQTLSVTSPDGAGPVGSLVTLLPFGVSQHAQIFELHLADWLVAFDPNYPGYVLYHAAYAQALTQTAEVVGMSG
ncbi:MAG: hypothetical protein L3K02_07745 [Thermoplasmata archaeon]|nr:hypothetical protein [Thermoplasmata archaeon]